MANSKQDIPIAEIRKQFRAVRDNISINGLRIELNKLEDYIIKREEIMKEHTLKLLEFAMENRKGILDFTDVLESIENKANTDSSYTAKDALREATECVESIANKLEIIASDDHRPVEDVKDTHLMSWLTQGYVHCKFGSEEWCTNYLMSAYNYIMALERKLEKTSYTLPDLSDEQKDELRKILKENDATLSSAVENTDDGRVI